MNIKRKLLIAAMTAMPAAGVGGFALASTATAAPTPPPVSAPAPASTPAAGNSTTTGPETPDATETPGAVEAPGAGEGTTAQNDGPSGHQDASGTNADHQFNGQE